MYMTTATATNMTDTTTVLDEFDIRAGADALPACEWRYRTADDRNCSADHCRDLIIVDPPGAPYIQVDFNGPAVATVTSRTFTARFGAFEGRPIAFATLGYHR